MKENLKEILMGKGLGTLTFGSTREEVKGILGNPTEKEKYNLSDDDGDTTEAWHYDEHDISLSFDEEYDWKLSSVAISSEDYTLDGQVLIGKSKDAVLKELGKKNLGEIEEDEEISDDNPENCLLHIEESSISLWFENDILTEIQWGPFIQDDEILWPAK